MKNQRQFFDALVERYTKKEFIESDPILFCYKYKSRQDIEIVGFISALFAYGNVSSINSHLEKLFQLFGKYPFEFIRMGDFSKIENQIPKYRFQTSKDILIFLKALSEIVKSNSSLEVLFKSENKKLNERIIYFQKYFLDIVHKITDKNKTSYGLKFLIGSGILKSSHKRYCMFLRWMVRDSFPDFGFYKSISKTELLYPTDVHIVRLSSILGFSNRKTVDYLLAKSITDYFYQMNQEDPLAYDFALSRLGILKICKAKYLPEICEYCELKKVCNIYKVR